MQIEVIDDCSTQVEWEAIVRAIPSERVSLYRQPKHVSITANWNMCIQRARGHLVHILHDDDYVLPGFYEAIQNAFDTTEVGLVACRCFQIDAEGEIDCLSMRVPAWEKSSKDLTPLFEGNPLCMTGVVVRRNFYEEFGGYADLSYVPDWEMWIRIARLRGALFLNWPLAAWRIHPQSESNRLHQTGDSIRDELRIAELWRHTARNKRLLDFEPLLPIARFTRPINSDGLAIAGPRMPISKCSKIA